MKRRTPIESGLARYVRTEHGLLELDAPPVIPTSAARFARSRPLAAPCGVPLFTNAREIPPGSPPGCSDPRSQAGAGVVARVGRLDSTDRTRGHQLED